MSVIELEVPGKTPTGRDFIDFDLDSMPAIEWGVDGYTSLGLTIIAGEPGVGKTSAIVPLAAFVAHLIDPHNGDNLFSLRPTLRRHIVFVTEAPEQVHSMLYGIKHHMPGATAEEIKKWFHVVPAMRIEPERIGADIRYWRKRFTYQAGPELNGYLIEPLIIIDTANANLELENENDNSEVGRACASIKEAMMDDGVMRGMSWLVSHTPKALKRADAEHLTVRGASAWEGDANATIYLATDDSLPDKRFMVLGKKRFVPEFKEIEISSEIHTYTATTKWGKTQSLSYIVCNPTALASSNGMKRQAAEARGVRLEEEIIKALEDAYSECGGKGWRGLTQSTMTKIVEGKTAYIRDSLKALAKTGRLLSETSGTGPTAPTYYWLKGQIREPA